MPPFDDTLMGWVAANSFYQFVTGDRVIEPYQQPQKQSLKRSISLAIIYKDKYVAWRTKLRLDGVVLDDALFMLHLGLDKNDTN